MHPSPNPALLASCYAMGLPSLCPKDPGSAGDVDPGFSVDVDSNGVPVPTPIPNDCGKCIIKTFPCGEDWLRCEAKYCPEFVKKLCISGMTKGGVPQKPILKLSEVAATAAERDMSLPEEFHYASGCGGKKVSTSAEATGERLYFTHMQALASARRAVRTPRRTSGWAPHSQALAAASSGTVPHQFIPPSRSASSNARRTAAPRAAPKSSRTVRPASATRPTRCPRCLLPKRRPTDAAPFSTAPPPAPKPPKHHAHASPTPLLPVPAAPTQPYPHPAHSVAAPSTPIEAVTSPPSPSLSPSLSCRRPPTTACPAAQGIPGKTKPFYPPMLCKWCYTKPAPGENGPVPIGQPVAKLIPACPERSPCPKW